eukprot:1140006-Pelagomonas_calceolata.AAC.5
MPPSLASLARISTTRAALVESRPVVGSSSSSSPGAHSSSIAMLTRRFSPPDKEKSGRGNWRLTSSK